MKSFCSFESSVTDPQPPSPSLFLSFFLSSLFLPSFLSFFFLFFFFFVKKKTKMKRVFQHEKIVRTMPNVPVAVQEGMVPYYCSSAVTDEQRQVHVYNNMSVAIIFISLFCQLVAEMCSAMGKSVEVAKEAQMDMATAISGSSPAYFLLILEGNG